MRRCRFAAIALGFLAAARLLAADFVIAISADGMGSAWLQPLIEAGKLPHFRRLEAEGAFTTNARCDAGSSATLPNHVTMVTGRPVLGPRGHGWTSNTDPARGINLHSHRGAYVAGVFDVVHAAGRRSGVWAGKTKFSLFDASYGPTPPDEGMADEFRPRGVLDVWVYGKQSPALVKDFLDAMKRHPCHFALVHLTDGDTAGHTSGWGSPEYEQALRTVDDCVGRILDFVASEPPFRGRTTVLVTADHGGHERGHGDPTHPMDCTIPFFAWGADVTPGDLYVWNKGRRDPPEGGCPADSVEPPPIRNGEVANLSLFLLGLPSVPGSVHNAAQDLRVGP